MLKRHIEDSRFFASNTAIAAIGVALAGTLVAGEGLAKQKPGFVLVGTGVALPSIAIAYFSRYQVAACDAFARHLRALDDRIAAAKESGRVQCEQTHPGLIREAIARADRQYRTQLSAATTEARRQGYSEGASASRAQLEESRRKAIAQLHQRHADELADLENRHEIAIAQLRSDSQSELTQLAQRHKSEIVKLQSRHATERGELEAAIGQLRSEVQEWEQNRADIDSDLAAIQGWRIEMARHEGKIEQLESERLTFDMRLQQMEELAQAKTQELLECIAEEREAGYAAGYKKAIDELATERERLLLELERWKLRALRREQREALESRLPSIGDVIGGELRPLAIFGGQRTGKATAAIAIASTAYSHPENGVVLIAYDNSEGGEEGSTWNRSKVPSFKSPELCVALISAIVQNLDKRPITGSPRHDEMPTIVVVLDEIQTALFGLEKEERKAFVDALTFLRTQGAKRKVFPILLNQSCQIQNQKSSGEKIINGGNLTGFHQFLINDQILAFKKQYGIEGADGFEEYMESFGANYRMAFVKDVNGTQKLVPVTHPSHHGQILKEKVPTCPIPTPNLAPCPKWFPSEIRAIYEEWSDSTDAHGTDAHSTHVRRTRHAGARSLKVLPGGQSSVVCAPEKEGDIESSTGGNADARNRLLDAIKKGLNQDAAILEVFGQKRSPRNKKWQERRDLYKQLKSEVSPEK